MNFVLFLMLNAILLIRPEELIPEIAGLRLYLLVICGCILTTGQRIFENLQPSELVNRPITLCVIGLGFAGVLSQLVRGQFGLASDFAGDFVKVIIYYLLLISVLDSPERLRAFLGWLVGFVVLITILGLLQYHGVIDVDALQPLERRSTGDGDTIQQLRGTGYYNDPNDLCLILVTAAVSALACSATSSGILLRLFWMLPIGLFGYATTLTQSRGGLLGLIAAGIIWAGGQFGWKKMIPIAVVAIPGLILLAGGRQAEMNLDKQDTAQQRVEFWYEGFAVMARNPITGIGVYEYAEEIGYVAHNSYVHAYVETGIIGGGLFLGAFYFAVVSILNCPHAVGSLTVKLRPFFLAIVAGYIIGLCSLSRNYIEPTYLILGLIQAYVSVALPSSPGHLRLGRQAFVRLLLVGVAGYVLLRIATGVLLALG